MVKDHHLSHPRDTKSKDLSHETPREIEYLRNLYSVLSVTYINWKIFQRENLRDCIEFVLDGASDHVARYTGVRVDRWEVNWPQIIKDKSKHMRLNYSSIEKTKTRCRVQMRKLKKDLKDDVVMPDAQLEWHAKNEATHASYSQLRVKKMFEDLFAKYKNSELPPQLVAPKKSEEYDKHPHDNDKLILAQTTYITSVYSESKIYIASNDKKFFSPYNGDRTITDAICDEFEITCDSAKIMANSQVCDGPPQMEMDESDYQLCLEKKHPRLEYVGTFKSTENGCIKI